MKNFALLAAAVIGSGVLIATPSWAQVQLGIGPNGPTVRIGPDNDRVVERRIVRRQYVGDRVVTTGSVRRCRTVTVQEEDDFGDTIVRRRRSCR
ncbi:MAG TPA: hypothetical protein VHG30_11635 [Microvirga sp.]|jgi:hypothetical protein|nr:hypothetical protein [Microvirga sp.]